MIKVLRLRSELKDELLENLQKELALRDSWEITGREEDSVWYE
jgi:hypothetical protein